MNFRYRARDMEGKLVTGTIEALHEKDAFDALGARDLLIVDLRTLEPKRTAARKHSGGKIKLVVLAGFTRQLATMLRAGLTLINSLRGLTRQSSDPKLKAVLTDIVHAVENGAALSEALQLRPDAFSALYVNITKAGEAGGVLPEVLDRLAGYLESSVKLRQKIRSAMVYPTIVSLLGIGICLFMLTTIIPVFVDIYKEFGQKLPMPTLVMMRLSSLVRNNWVMFLVLTAGSVWGVRWFRHTVTGQLLWDKYRLRMPLFGQLASKIVFSRFCRTQSTLEHSGVPVLKALQTSAHAVDNVVVQAAVMQVAHAIEHGATMLQALERQKLFPAMMLEMVAAGEETGGVDEMLAQVADHYDREIEAQLAGLTSLIEPVLILFLGIIVGSVVVAMFLPIFKMTDAIAF